MFWKKSPEEVAAEARQKRIEEAVQHEKHRKPNPCRVQFPQENFMEFRVVQDQVINLHTYSFPQKGELKAIMFMFHGLNAYTQHSAHVAEALSNIGVLSVGFDHRGFGKSEGLRAYIANVETHLEDSRTFIKKVLQFYNIPPNIPIFLSGLSMGGMTSFRLAIEEVVPIRGIVLFAPAIKHRLNKMLVKGAQLMGFVMGKSTVIKPKRGLSTKNPGITEELVACPYTYTDDMRPATISMICTAMEQAEKMFSQLRCPWLVIQGGLDKLVDPDLAEQLMRESPSKDKEIMFYDNMWHDIYHEEEIEEIIPRVIQWVQNRL